MTGVGAGVGAGVGRGVGRSVGRGVGARVGGTVAVGADVADAAAIGVGEVPSDGEPPIVGPAVTDAPAEAVASDVAPGGSE
jgi:hypothetical protein